MITTNPPCISCEAVTDGARTEDGYAICSNCKDELDQEIAAEAAAYENLVYEGWHDQYDDDPSPYSGTYSED